MARIDRRTLLAAAPLVAGGALASKAVAQAVSASPSPPEESVSVRLAKRAAENLHPITFDGVSFSGAGWDLILTEARASEFTLVGEEHGLAEIPVLVGVLFEALRPAGYDKLAIELSAPVADDLDRAAKTGLAGLKAYYAKYPPGPAFFSWKPEAELLVRTRAAVPAKTQAIWGLDYEVLNDRALFDRLRPKVPSSAKAAFDALDKASINGWAQWRATKNVEVIPTFATDPTLAQALVEAWPSPDRESAIILEVLAETLEINRIQQTSGYFSNQRRAALNRKTLVRLLTENKGAKAVFKMGSTHTMRGLSWTSQFDVGTLAAEAAALRGGKSFHLLVGGGVGGRHGVTDPSDMSVKVEPVDMIAEAFGMQFLLDVMPKSGLGLLDLRPLRSIASYTPRLKDLNNPDAVRVIHGYDMMLVWNGSTPTTLL